METITNPKEIATELSKLVGNKALLMMGAFNLFFDKDGSFQFRIRGCKEWKHIKITVNALDLLDVTFTTWKGEKFTTKEVKGIYNDMLHKTIETETGLYLNI